MAEKKMTLDQIRAAVKKQAKREGKSLSRAEFAREVVNRAGSLGVMRDVGRRRG